MASLAIVKMLQGRNGDAFPGMDCEPRAVFTAVAECYRRGPGLRRPAIR